MKSNEKSLDRLFQEVEEARLRETDFLTRGEELLNRAREIARAVQARVQQIVAAARSDKLNDEQS